MSKLKSHRRDSPVAEVIDEDSKVKGCAFCNRAVNDEVLFGKLYRIGSLYCHYFCVLLSCCLVQKGEDNEGLLGFLYPDILAELERSKKHKCSYCGQGGATLGCVITKCRKQFHLPCGREKRAISMYYGNYKSFCEKHAPQQKIAPDVMEKAQPRLTLARKVAKNTRTPLGTILDENEPECVCVICYEAVPGYPTSDTFWPPCCARDEWIHRTCLQRMALSAGLHFIKCPLCNDRNTFYKAVVSQGYYLPDRDAAWELEQNAFSAMYERELKCEADICLCESGPYHDEDTGLWDIRLCLCCGGAGCHRGCLRESLRYVCRDCTPLLPDDMLPQLITREQEEAKKLSQNTPRAINLPRMTSRMSIRRTKPQVHSKSVRGYIIEKIISSEKNEEDDHTNVQELTSPDTFLETNCPKSPMEVFKMQVQETLSAISSNSKLVEKVRLVLGKPGPLSAKMNIVNSLLQDISNENNKEAMDVTELQDVSPVPVQFLEEPDTEHCTAEEISTKDIAETPKETEKLKFNSEQPNIFTEETVIHNTNNAKTVDTLNNSSIEISENNQTIKIDHVKMESTDDVTENIKTNDNNIKVSINFEKFKTEYLNELFNKSCCNHKHIIDSNSDTKSTFKTAIDFAIEAAQKKNLLVNNKEIDEKNQINTKKRKRDTQKTERKLKKKRKNHETTTKLELIYYKGDDSDKNVKKRKKKMSSKENVSIESSKGIALSIKWKEEQGKLKITNKSKRRREKRRAMRKQKILTQTILAISPEGKRDVVIAKPEVELTPAKRKYTKNERQPDALRQTSLRNFFVMKSPK